MSKYVKTGILIVLLVVPVLIFIFLRGFTTNQYALPYYLPLRDSTTNQVLMTQEGDTIFYQIKDFTLENTLGQKLTRKSLAGRVTVVSAVADSCSEACYKGLNQLSRVIALNKTNFPVGVLVLVQSDEAQLPNAIRQSREPAWQIIAVPDSLLKYHIANTFRLSENLTSPEPSLYLCCLIDENGYIRGYYDASDPDEVDRLLAEIKILEYNKNITE